MDNVPPAASPTKPRRLDFSKKKPRSAKAIEHDERAAAAARAARAAKPELFLQPPGVRPRLPADADFDLHFDHARCMWSGSFECDGVFAWLEATTLKFIVTNLDEKWRHKIIERDALVAQGKSLVEANALASSPRPREGR